MTAVTVVVTALAAAAAFALWRSQQDGRFSAGSAARDPNDLVLTPAEVGAELGSRATLLQVSSTFCQPCRAARAVLAHVAATTEGVRHVEVDAAREVELVRRLRVMRTPTVFVLDGSGRVVSRAAGVPTVAQARAGLPH